MIKQNSGEPIINGYKKAGSVAFAFNDVVTVDASGFLVKATASTTLAKIVGLIQATVLATDVDYTANTVVPVLETMNKEAELMADVGTGSAVQAMVGTAYDLKDAVSIDVTATTIKVFKITKVITTTKVLGYIMSV